VVDGAEREIFDWYDREHHLERLDIGGFPSAQTLERGAMLASVDFGTLRMACVAVETLLRSRNSQKIPVEVILPIEIIDQSNFKAALILPGERSCPTWNEAVGSSQ
jgi:hypothetical protein